MNIYVVVGVTLVVVVGGLVAARLWWNLASKNAPYADEHNRAPTPHKDEAEVVSWTPHAPPPASTSPATTTTPPAGSSATPTSAAQPRPR
ncbi:MAG: hypothetical protein AB7O77_00985 [Phycisphaerales bacterium]